MGNTFSGLGGSGSEHGDDVGEQDSLTVGLSIDEIEQLTAPAHESHLARLERLSRREKVVEVFKSVTFGTVMGQYSFLLFLALVLLIIGTIGWMQTTGTQDYDTSLDQSIWLSYCMFIDIGTQTAVSADESWQIKLTVAILSFFGFCFNLTFLSVVVDNVRTLLDRLYTRYSQLIVRDHVVILGWTSKTLFLVNELISMFDDNGGKGDIIIMGNSISRYEMLRTVELAFRRRNPPKPRGVRIRVMT
ncbi:hypothetical protein T492DRAFT_897360 [Pavlovales sp. CCMP2436]|nr:hypothetical protein T492DRAFT_897360 [Pavlovales sp. CCMP2436]